MIASLARLGVFVAKYRGRLIGGISAFALARILEALVPLLLMVGIDRLQAGQGGLVAPALGIVAVVLARFGVVSFARMAVRRAGLLVAFDLRQKLYAHLQGMGPKFFGRYTIGDMMTRAVVDIGLIQRLISHGTILAVVLAFASIVGFAFMLSLSVQLTLLIFPPLPIVFLYAWKASRRAGMASRAVQERLSGLGALTQENLSGIRTIQAMTQEENEIERFSGANQAYADAFYRQSRIHSEMSAIMPTLAAVCSITILGYGGHLVLAGEMTVGEFTAFFLYVNMVAQPFRVAGFIVNLFQRAAVASDRLFEVFERGAEIEDAPAGGAPAHIGGDIAIRGLTFAYQGADTPVLRNIELSIQRGESIAIMGRVGAGKTTLLKQLVRMLDTPPGTAFIDGVDVRDYPLAQLRSQVAMVPQDPFLFGEPVRDNLTYDDPSRAIELIWQAADAADFKETVAEMPERMDTLVGERGVTLSGGQKQRATLARGLIRHAPVLILDDCFSSVDTETEARILTELKQLRRGQTTLLVSHRVATARHADRIVVMDAGAIIESGDHNTLLAAGGAYAELERIQREGADAAPRAAATA